MPEPVRVFVPNPATQILLYGANITQNLQPFELINFTSAAIVNNTDADVTIGFHNSSLLLPSGCTYNLARTVNRYAYMNIYVDGMTTGYVAISYTI